jgi:hypothetical protein
MFKARDQMLKEVKVTVSVKVVFSTYLSKGFVLYIMNELYTANHKTGTLRKRISFSSFNCQVA